MWSPYGPEESYILRARIQDLMKTVEGQVRKFHATVTMDAYIKDLLYVLLTESRVCEKVV